jgi:iron complex outermembrane receptor protein
LNRCIKIIVLFFLGMVLSRLHAQDTITLQSVDVTADKYNIEALKPLVARKLDTLVLQSKSTSSLSDLLIQHSPVFIKTYGPGGTSTASFRGTTASHTLVLWNGFQLNAPSLGQVDFSTIPVFLADDVSLNWGSGTSNNSGGLGGAVNIDNTHHFGDGFLLDLKQTYGSFNTLGSFLTVGNYGKKFSFRVKAYRNSSDNDFEYENLATIPHQTMQHRNADFVDYGVMPEMSLMLGNNVISVSSWNQWNNRNLPPIMPNVFNVNSEEWTRDNFSRNFISYKTYWETGSLQLKSAAFAESQRYFLLTRNPITDDTVTFINSENHALILHQIANLDQQLYKSWTLKAKLQWDHERVRSNNYEGEKRRNLMSAYAALNGEPFACANLNLTARFDWTDGKAMGLFPTATFTYHFLEYYVLTLGYSHNYRNPSLNDLYWYPGGNPDLLPENGRTVDLALGFNVDEDGGKLNVRTGAYFSNVKNWIQWMPTSYRFWVPENVSKVYARGIENHISFSYKYGDQMISLSGNYVFTVTTDESEKAYQQGINGKQLIYIPRHHANFFLNTQWKTWNLSYTLEITGRRSTSYNAQEFFAYDLPSYVLHHVSLGKQLKKFRIELRCNNLFDTDYQNVIWRAMPGRSFEVMGEYKF